jgi:PAS domain S-box-containing protein
VSPSALALFVLACAAHAADPPEVRVGSELGFRPYCFTDKNGQPTGFGVELLQAVAEKATLRLHISPGEWDRVWNALVAGEIDVLPVVARTPGREGLVEFTLPHTETFDAFFVRAGRPPIEDLAAAAGKEIVVLRSDAAHHQLVERKFPGTIVPADSIAEGLQLIASGQHDALLCSRLIGVLERDQAGITDVTDGPVIPDYKRVFSFAVRKGNTDLAERLNQGLRLVRADGTYDRLYRQWLGGETLPRPTWQTYSWQAIGIVGVLVLIAVTWIVARKTLESDRRQSQGLTPQPCGALSAFWRYALAVVAVAAGYAVRVGLEAWVGRGLPTFVTFYPAVMVAALLGGIGPGLLATAVAAVIAGIWIMPPSGQLWIASPVDRLAVVLFCGMGLFMTAVAELYRRNRAKAAAFDREQALRESREALRRHAELVDPIRAALIAQEMQRAVRERGSAAAPPPRPAANPLRHVPIVAGAVLAGVGSSVLAGWIFGVDALKRVLPNLPTMKANTALCFFFAGVSLLLLGPSAVAAVNAVDGTAGRHRPPLEARHWTGMAAALVVLLVAGVTMAQYVTGADFGIDRLLFRDTRDLHTIFPGRMVEATGIGFLLGSLSLLLMGTRSRAGRRTQQTLALGTGLIGVIAVLGFAYGAEQLYRFAGYSSMALQTALSLVLLAAGLVFARPDGLPRVLTTPGPAAQLARRLLPMALLAPPVVGWLVERGLQHGFYGAGIDIAALALAMMVSLSGVVWWTADVLHRVDATRREHETHLRNQAELMDQAGEALIVREMDGTIRSWNRGAEKLYGWSAAEVVGQRTHVLLRTPPGKVQEFESVLEQAGHWEGELVHTTRDGRCITVESRKTATRTADGRMLVLESNRDITDRKAAEAVLHAQAEQLQRSQQAALNLARDATAARRQAEQSAAALRESERRLIGVLESMPDAFVSFDADMRYTYVNANAERLQAARREELLGQDVRAVCPDAEARKTISEYERVLREQRPVTATSYHAGFDRWVEIRAFPTPDGVSVFYKDVSAQVKAEEALRRSETRWNAAIETFAEGAIIATEDEQVIYWNPAAREMHGFTRLDEGLEPLEKTPVTFQLWTPDGSHMLELDEWPMRRIKRGEAVRNLELRIRRPDQGWEKVFSYSGAMVETAGGERLILLSCYDLTELRRAEERIRASLAEKEVLLKEVHHRVKNNMQVISSLVSLQADQVQDGTLREVLRDVTHRVRSMALVHEKLYQSADLARVEFAEYARSLLRYLWRAHGSAVANVRLTLDLEPVPLPVSTAVPCGLILNELASNALRHAFPMEDSKFQASNDKQIQNLKRQMTEREPCEVCISLRADPEGRVCLGVRDNGAGLPAGLDWRQARSLGLRLVHILAGQLRATVEVSSGEGTEFTITF